MPVGFDGWYIKTLWDWFIVANLFILLDTFLDRDFVAHLFGNILAVTFTVLRTLLLIHCLALWLILGVTVILRYGFAHLFLNINTFAFIINLKNRFTFPDLLSF